MHFKKIKFIVFLIALLPLQLLAQIYAGKIVYERKTNIYKRFADIDIKDWVPDKDKIRTETFNLYFNPQKSYFEYQESDLKDPLSWTTTQSFAYVNSNSKEIIKIKNISGDKLIMKDSLRNWNWKITDSKRNIAGYSCRKAFCKPDDSTTIYAWYCLEVIPSIGPEIFQGLPGAILGLATEDGGIVFFAKSITAMKVEDELLNPNKLKGTVYEPEALRKKLDKQFGDYNWGKRMVKNIFAYL